MWDPFVLESCGAVDQHQTRDANSQASLIKFELTKNLQVELEFLIFYFAGSSSINMPGSC